MSRVFKVRSKVNSCKNTSLIPKILRMVGDYHRIINKTPPQSFVILEYEM